LPSALDLAGKTSLVVTSARGLAGTFEGQGVEDVLSRLRDIVRLRREGGVRALLYVPDRKDTSAGLPHLEAPITARALQAAIGEIEKSLHGGRPFTYVFLVGNSRVLPSWRLDNPAADSDQDFPSDAPYAVSNEVDGSDACLVPERGVGRLPLDGEKHAGRNLLSCLEDLAASGAAKATGGSFGLAAAVWRAQAAKVYGLVQDGGLKLSPPLDLESFGGDWLGPRSILYFNVHGSKDERYWYGQMGLVYPRVLSPEIVARSNPAGSLVLSEACYGGLIEDKRPETSIALQFMSRGVDALVGASAIAYGSPDERLSEADLLAYLFLKRILAGEAYGDALRESKIDFAAEMLRRQGYLDGDDRKTLVEFNLFGDPVLSLTGGAGGRGLGQMISDEIVDCVKRIAASRFPEMDGVEPELAEEKTALDGGLAQKVLKQRPAPAQKGGGLVIERRVFVASFKRHVVAGDRSVERIVRITFDERGEILKIVTSK